VDRLGLKFMRQPPNFPGLEDQLLGKLILKEKHELEEQRQALLEEVQSYKKKIKQLEDDLLFRWVGGCRLGPRLCARAAPCASPLQPTIAASTSAAQSPPNPPLHHSPPG
jgi:hypothetical protein